MGAIYRNGFKVCRVIRNNDLVTKEMINGTLAFQGVCYDIPSYSGDYLTIRAVEDGTRVEINWQNYVDYTSGLICSIQDPALSYDGGETWETFRDNVYAKVLTLNSGDTVLCKGTAMAYSSHWVRQHPFAIYVYSGMCDTYGNILSFIYNDDFEEYNSTDWHYSNVFNGRFRYANNLVLPSGGTFYGNSMFWNSTIITAPELPATALTEGCYAGMFEGCTRLVKAPALPVTTLANSCYYNMFEGCTSLTIPPPVLPATTLTHSCYTDMFEGCTSLTTPPVICGVTMNDYCCERMFSGCSSLLYAPVLEATVLADSCYEEMFAGCTSLISAQSALPATTIAVECYESMFKDCSSLTKAPLLPATSLSGAYYCYCNMFAGCTSLINVQSALPATTLYHHCYYGMFSGCTSLVNAPALPATTLANNCYYGMFEGCTSLVNAPALPSLTLADYCYMNMFAGCTSLTKAPDLEANTLPIGSYNYMFSGCTNLNYIRSLNTNFSVSGSAVLMNWVSGVQTVSGLFVKKTGVTWNYGNSRVPNNWTIVNDSLP